MYGTPKVDVSENNKRVNDINKQYAVTTTLHCPVSNSNHITIHSLFHCLPPNNSLSLHLEFECFILYYHSSLPVKLYNLRLYFRFRIFSWIHLITYRRSGSPEYRSSARALEIFQWKISVLNRNH